MQDNIYIYDYAKVKTNTRLLIVFNYINGKWLDPCTSVLLGCLDYAITNIHELIFREKQQQKQKQATAELYYAFCYL